MLVHELGLCHYLPWPEPDHFTEHSNVAGP